jgi:oxygen-independent coproporphyrinogen-3 oxidase
MHLYVHFPWCLEKCPYCDFVSYRTTREEIDHPRYTDAVIRELHRRLEDCTDEARSSTLESVFFGGGTPSLWDPPQLGRFLSALRASFPANQGAEITVECNPSSLDLDRARALLDAGVNRLSIGVQSLDDERLRFLGRLHDADGALRSVRAALASGIPRVSADLIYAVARQRPDEAVHEAHRLLDEGLSHLSAYSLTIENGTRFGELARRGRLPLADDGAMVESFFALHEALGARGLSHYEVSNYAAPGHASLHNLGYWRGHPYLGLGCAAVGMIRTRDGALRYRNQPLPERYLDACAEAPTLVPGGLAESTEALDGETLLRERIMLGLRLAEGFDLEAAAQQLGVDPWPPSRARAAERMVQRGRLLREGGRLRAPLSAWALVDGTAAELF